MKNTKAICLTALILGNLIGVGILALPITLGVAGMLPSLVLMLVYSAMMLFSAEVLARETAETRNPIFDFPTLYERYLGKFGKWIAIATNALILYGLLVAYIAGGTKIVASLLGIPGSPVWLMLAFAATLTFLTLWDLSILDKYNTILVFIILVAFVGLVLTCCDKIYFPTFTECHWEYFGIAIPLVVTATHFHNIIPTLSANLKWDLAPLRKAMLCGMILAVLMNLVWVACGVGCLPRFGDNSLIAAYAAFVPATVPMGVALNRPVFKILSVVFSIFAIVTPFIANGIGLQNFVRDICENSFKVKSKLLVRFVTFAPPIIIALVWPNVFLKALNVVGGIGIVTLFGILPCIIALLKKGNSRLFRTLAVAFLVLSFVAFATVVGGLCGSRFLKPDPMVESGSTPCRVGNISH